MTSLQILSKAELISRSSFRNGEIKFAERVCLINTPSDWQSELKTHTTKYVVVGICEDIGVKANFGRQGTQGAYSSFLNSFLNLQHNKFCKASQISVLGHLDFSEQLAKASQLDPKDRVQRTALFNLVVEIDKEVTHVVSSIVQSGKIPIIIGGGHNNSYGNIKGTALAKGKAINAINFDAHSDFRPLEGRHSGNGFSYSFEEGFLKNYFIWGLHENYTSKTIFGAIKENNTRIKYNTYEQLCIRKEKNITQELALAKDFVSKDFFGIEIDLDALPNTASSALTPSGFSVEQLREFIHYFGQSKHAAYLHICEGAPSLDTPNNPQLIGKLISYLVTDFIKANTLK